MRRLRRGARGLAEIVGTLMLVVIVVAAATAFSFFVASYQSQLQAEETLSHDKALEDLRILNLAPSVLPASPDAALSNLRVELASLDVNAIAVVGMTINTASVVNYTVEDAAGHALAYGCFNGGVLAGSTTSCSLVVPAEAQVFLDFNLTFASPTYAFGPALETLTATTLLQFASLTTLGNDFAQSFVPPVAVAQVTFVGSNPLLDGQASYQPGAGSGGNATVDVWAWNVTGPSGAVDVGTYFGQEVELPEPFTSGDEYTIELTVTNSESLVGTATISYTFG